MNEKLLRQIGTQIFAQFRDWGRTQIDDRVSDQVFDLVSDLVSDQVSAQIRDQISDQISDPISDRGFTQILAQIDAGELVPNPQLLVEARAQMTL